MKAKITITLLTLGGVLVLAAGCGKTEKAGAPAAANTPAPASDATKETMQAAETARNADEQKAAEMAQAAETQLKADSEKLALDARAAEAQRMAAAEADMVAAKLAEAERFAAQTAADAKIAAEKLQADAKKATADTMATANTTTGSLTQKALSALQQPGQIENMIASAKNLTGQNKYSEALKIVAELAKLQLTPEQRTMVDQLKLVAEQQLAKAMQAGATDMPAGETVPDMEVKK